MYNSYGHSRKRKWIKSAKKIVEFEVTDSFGCSVICRLCWRKIYVWLITNGHVSLINMTMYFTGVSKCTSLVIDPWHTKARLVTVQLCILILKRFFFRMADFKKGTRQYSHGYCCFVKYLIRINLVIITSGGCS